MNIEFENVLEAVHGLPAMPVAIVDADEPHVLQGAWEAADAGLIDPILIGPEKTFALKFSLRPAALCLS